MTQRWLFTTALAGCASLAAIPASAATMQAVFTGVGVYQSGDYYGSCDTCEDIRYETVMDETYAGTPGKITIVYDTDLAETGYTEYDSGTGTRRETLRLDNAITSISVMSGDEVIYSLSTPGGIDPAGGWNFISDDRDFWPVTAPEDSGAAEQFNISAHTALVSIPGDNQVTDRSYTTSGSFYAYRLFSAFDLETPFSVLVDEVQSPQMYLSQDDMTFFYDGETYLGYQRAITSYLWWTNSLTVTRLDEPPAPAPVPLPAGAPLILSGIAGLIGLKRLKRRA